MSTAVPHSSEPAHGLGTLLGTTAVTVVLLGGLAFWHQPWRADEHPPQTHSTTAGNVEDTPVGAGGLSALIDMYPSGLAVQADGARARTLSYISTAGTRRTADTAIVVTTELGAPWVAVAIEEANAIRSALALPDLSVVLAPSE